MCRGVVRDGGVCVLWSDSQGGRCSQESHLLMKILWNLVWSSLTPQPANGWVSGVQAYIPHNHDTSILFQLYLSTQHALGQEYVPSTYRMRTFSLVCTLLVSAHTTSHRPSHRMKGPTQWTTYPPLPCHRQVHRLDLGPGIMHLRHY